MAKQTTYWHGQTDSPDIDHRQLVNNDRTNPDVEFLIEDKTIYAHSFIILVRAPLLLENSSIAKVKKKKKRK